MALFTPILKYVWKENAKLDAARIRLQTPTAGVDCVCNIPYINDKTAEHMLDVYFPENSNERLPVIIDIHGGGSNISLISNKSPSPEVISLRLSASTTALAVTNVPLPR